MIKAKFENKSLIIDLSNMEDKYKENGKKIIFTLFYWTEYTGSDWGDSYRVEWKKEIEYSWENEVIIEVEEVKKWYRWNSIFIWYYIEVNFWKKFLVFKDSKEINISRKENNILYRRELSNSIEYKFEKDEYSYKEIFKNLPNIKKWFLWGSLFLAIISLGFSIFSNYGFFIPITVIFIIAFLILFFTAGRWYFKWNLNKNIKDWNNFSELIKWDFKRDLKEIKLQLFACNSEKWNYEVNDGSTTRTVWFNTQVWSVLLFEKKFENLKSGTKIENLLKWKIDFSEVYKNLFPRIAITTQMWLFTNLEFRIISKNYKDILISEEFIFDSSKFITKVKNSIGNNTHIKNEIENKKETNTGNLNSDFFS